MKVTTQTYLSMVTLLLTVLYVVSGDNDTDQTTEHYPITDGVSVTTVDPNIARNSSLYKTISNTSIQTTQKYTDARSVYMTFSTLLTLTPTKDKAKQHNQKYTGSSMSLQVNATSSTPGTATGTPTSSQINATSSPPQATTINPKSSSSSTAVGEIASNTTIKSLVTSSKGPKTTLSRITNRHVSTTSKVTTKRMPITEHLLTEEQTRIYVENVTYSGRLRYTYDEFDAGDKLWPVGMALIIGLPTIIVLAVTITVLYKRQVAKPRSRMSFYGQNYAKI